MSKSLLVISRQTPMSGPSAREALDIVLAGGAFDLPIGLLFMDDGVFQLQPGQQASAVQRKDLSANLQALEMFGIEHLYACAESLAQRGMPPRLDLDAVQVLTPAQMSALIDRYNQVITL